MARLLCLLVTAIAAALAVGAAARDLAHDDPARDPARDDPAEACVCRRGAGAWKTGVATYYTTAEGGPLGAGGARLRAFRSVAVPLDEFEDRRGREVEIRDVGTFRVDDGCAGSGCRDFDIYVGDDEENARRLPDWEAGNMPIEYRWVD